MFCSKCGKNLPDGASFCSGCGASTNSQNASPTNSQPGYQPMTSVQSNYQPGYQPVAPKVKKGSIPAFIVGLIGAIFGIFGGLCVAACHSLGGNDTEALILIVGGSILGLIGSCLCFKKGIVGSILLLVAAVLIAICVFAITGADFMTLIGMILMAVAGIVGLLTSK